jgi:hypothetical protein
MEYKVIFCVFAGRERYMNILQRYIDILLEKEWIHEYHIMNFTRNLQDWNYIEHLYERLNEQYPNRIFVHVSEISYENIRNKEKKVLWDLFYSQLGISIGDENSVIIKCDDDILYIDLSNFCQACLDRWNDRNSFVIHSNCINNGVCAYYHREWFPQIQDKIKLPRGGICGSIFEYPQLGYMMQYEYMKSVEEGKEREKYPKKEDIFLSTRISINFVFLHGKDIHKLQKVGKHDEFELSSQIPERFLRPNRILSSFVTCHYSYGMQESYLSSPLCKNLLPLYEKISLHPNYQEEILINKSLDFPKVHCKEDGIYIVKNPLEKDEYYLERVDGGYLGISKEGYVVLKEIKEDIFRISQNRLEYQIYPITKWNVKCISNEMMYMKGIKDKVEVEIEWIEEGEGEYYVLLKRYGEYLNYDENKDCILFSKIKKDKWKREMARKEGDDEIEIKREWNGKEFEYQNIHTGEKYRNQYAGWRFEHMFLFS